MPRSERRRFFDRMHADFIRYRPPGYRVPAGARGAKLRLIERDAYWTYELLEPVNKLRVADQARARVGAAAVAPAARPARILTGKSALRLSSVLAAWPRARSVTLAIG